ncbi:hypothetical protein [Agrobacterium pusense]|uniref:hypothetical protein n=1 Tax=Agrobacterium pusense TaxID=648995 RepID=UPI00345EED50
MNIISRQPRILEDTPKPVIVETRRSRGLAAKAARHAADALFKSPAKMIDHAVVSAVAASSVSGGERPPTDYEKVFALVASDQFEQAARLASKLINSDVESGLFVYGGTANFRAVESWVKHQIRVGNTARTSEFRELTPELAQILLLSNKGNRRVNAANLAAIMRDMAQGRWQPNGETIIVSKEGMLNDGQHRCFGALLTGACIETAVAFGVDRESIATVDIGRKRTGADRLGIGGVTNYVLMSAVSGLVLQMKNNRAPTPAETDAFFFDNRELIESACAASGTSMKGVGPSAGGAAAAYLISIGHSPVGISQFFTAVRSGEMMPKRDPRMLLHKAIFDARYKVKLSKDNWVRAFIAHFIAHKNGKTMSSVNWDVTLTWGI